VASERPDNYMAISSEVNKRIKKYYNRDSTVIYPPIQIPNPKSQNPNISKNTGFFLVVSRLVYYKRVDIAIEAFKKNKLPLKIVGTGREENNLKKMATSNIEFLENLTDDELSFYYKNSRALIFPGNEDFGLVMAEAQSFGKPVIAFKAGGALDIVKEGITGEFFQNQDAHSLQKVLEIFENKSYNSNLCKENSLRFSFENFRKSLMEIVNKNKI